MAVVDECVNQFSGGLDLAFWDPVDIPSIALEFSIPYVLSLAESTDFDQQLVAKFLACEFFLEVKGDVAVFESEVFEAFPGDSLLVQGLDFFDHAVFEALIKAFFNAFMDGFSGVVRSDQEGGDER